jgi:hypothetical protein
VAAEEDVVVARCGVRRGDDRVDVAREDQVRPVGEERDVVLGVVEDGAAVERRQLGLSGRPSSPPLEPVEGDLRIGLRLGDVEAGGVLELVAAPVVRPDLDDQLIVAARAGGRSRRGS